MTKFPKFPKWDFRDVSLGLQILREFLLGRKHVLHSRFPPKISPRSIPPPDIPISQMNRYADQYYFSRSAAASVRPPVVAPVAEGPPLHRDPMKSLKHYPPGGGVKPESIMFPSLPTPGLPWWWDGHCYYECTVDPEPVPPTCPPTPRPPTPRPPPPAPVECSSSSNDPCIPRNPVPPPCPPCEPCPPCPLAPDKLPKH